MPRTVNTTLYAVRRDAFLDVAQHLVQTRGYDAMSIQDVLDELETSKGAFYHYFDSKQTLLEAIVERFADGSIATLAPILADPTLPAIEKLERVFAGIGRWKAAQKELVLAIMEVWRSDSNAIVREKVRRVSETRMVPLISTLVIQGVEEGAFHVTSAEETARVFVALMLGFQERAIDLFIASQSRTITFEAVQRAIASLTEAVERILGIPQGSLTLMDEQALHFWFG
jgi:AcrR family transcriptional regulator